MIVDQAKLAEDRAKIRQICNNKPDDAVTIWSRELLEKLELEDLDLILRERIIAVESEPHVLDQVGQEGPR